MESVAVLLVVLVSIAIGYVLRSDAISPRGGSVPHTPPPRLKTVPVEAPKDSERG